MKVIVIFAVLILLSSGVYAISGVNPRSYEVDFVPNYERDLNFNFVIDRDSKVGLSVEGDLAKYVSLSKERILGRENIVALLRLPSVIDSPGVNQIRIIAGDVVAVIKVNVPYPEEYVELKLAAPNVNVGEVVDIVLEMFSKGNESVVAEPKIEIYNLGSLESEVENVKELIKTIEVDKKKIVAGELETFEWTLDTSNYSAGNYLVVALVNYSGEIARTENLFKIGKPSVRILNYTKEFRENKIERFEIKIESLSNEDVSGLFAEVNVIGLEDVGFAVPVVKLKAWDSVMFVGFLDTKKISSYDFEAEIA